MHAVVLCTIAAVCTNTKYIPVSTSTHIVTVINTQLPILTTMTTVFLLVGLNSHRAPFSAIVLTIFVLFIQLKTTIQQLQPTITTSENITDTCSKACVPITYEPYKDKNDNVSTTIWKHPKAGTVGVCFRCDEDETDCKGAQLSTICPQIVNSTIKRLTLSGNSIGPTINGSLVNATSLVHLDLRNNRLEGVFRENFKAAKQLEWLDLSENKIRAGKFSLRMRTTSNPVAQIVSASGVVIVSGNCELYRHRFRLGRQHVCRYEQPWRAVSQQSPSEIYTENVFCQRKRK